MQQECKIQFKHQLQSPFHALLSFQNYSRRLLNAHKKDTSWNDSEIVLASGSFKKSF